MPYAQTNAASKLAKSEVHTDAKHGHSGFVDQGRLLELLGSGLSNEVVAKAVGCDSAVIRAKLADPVFAAQVSELRVLNLNAANARDRKLDGIEDKLIERMEEVVETGFYKPRDILTALHLVNNLKRRGVPATNAISAQTEIVEIQLPNVIYNQIIFTENKEVVEVNGQSMVTMPAGQLLRQLSNSRSDKDADVYKEVARHLNNGPSGAQGPLIIENDIRKD